jgi:signal transduction histidine kinase
VIRRIPIRVRLAVAFAALAALLLAGGMAAVYVTEQSEVRHVLADEARTSAASLEAVAKRSRIHPVAGESEREDGAPPRSTTPHVPADNMLRNYLSHRQAGGLLLVLRRDTPSGKFLSPIANVPAALALRSVARPSGNGAETVRIGGAEYLLAVSGDPTRTALAALPMASVNAEVARLARTALVVTGAGILLAALLAWVMSWQALRPLERIAERSSRITHGDLSVRMGDTGGRDEIAQVSHALDDMLDRLENAFAAQTRFVQDASHELRTPLTIARGHLEVALLQDEPDSAQVRAAVELALAELDRMGRLVNSLLALARAERGGGGMQRQVDAGTLAELSVERSRALADRDWQVRVAPGTDTRVTVDPDAVEQVLLNLLANAARHTPAGGRIAVSVSRDNGQVEIDVADNGEGIAAGELPTLFDRFTRVDGARGRDSGGAGLGLAICRTIVESQGGSIRADSELGHGARFVIRLPASA